jgi:hypothetical protein
VTKTDLDLHVTSFSARALDLLKPGKASKLKKAGVSISCRCEEHAGGSTLHTAPGGQSAPFASSGPSLPSPSTSAVTVDPKQNLNVLEEFVLKQKESVHMSTPSGIETAETVIDAISSDNFGTVMGYIERFVQIGDAISEVSFYPASESYLHIKKFAGPPICETCVDSADCCAEGFSFHLSKAA